MSRILLVIMCLIVSFKSVAAEQPIVRAELSADSIAIGESVKLKITVLVPTWFSRPLVYPHLELANTITRLPDDSSYPIRESVGKQSWSGIVRSYEILPLLAANYTFNGQSVSVQYANPGGEPVSVEMPIPDVSFRAAAPAGSESLDPYIAGRNLTLELNVQGDSSALSAGDALVIEYSAELAGLPAIFLPPLAPEMSFEGVSVYADTPVVEDGATARRTEKVTLVFDAGGQFSIPVVTLAYWNTATESIEVAKTDDLIVSVTGAPATAPIESERSWTLPAAIVVGLGVLAYLIYAFGPAAVNAMRNARERRRQSEPFVFSQVQSSLKASNVEESYSAILHWLGRIEEGLSIRQFVQIFGDEALLLEFNSLSSKLYGGSTLGVDLGKLASGLKAARANYYRSHSQKAEKALPSLNP
jgi:hypothetical protein